MKKQGKIIPMESDGIKAPAVADREKKIPKSPVCFDIEIAVGPSNSVHRETFNKNSLPVVLTARSTFLGLQRDPERLMLLFVTDFSHKTVSAVPSPKGYIPLEQIQYVMSFPWHLQQDAERSIILMTLKQMLSAAVAHTMINPDCVSDSTYLDFYDAIKFNFPK